MLGFAKRKSAPYDRFYERLNFDVPVWVPEEIAMILIGFVLEGTKYSNHYAMS
jgi:hypothetical protein